MSQGYLQTRVKKNARVQNYIKHAYKCKHMGWELLGKTRAFVLTNTDIQIYIKGLIINL